MSIALAELQRSVRDVRNFLDVTAKKTDAIKSILESGVQGPGLDYANSLQSFASARTCDHIAAVVLLYGALERYIEDRLREYLISITRQISAYSDLPEVLRKSHFEQTTLHLNRTQDSRYFGQATATQLANSLASCLAGGTSYDFIPDSLLFHTSNFRPAAIDDYFSRVGISSVCRRVVNLPSFLTFLGNLPEPQTLPEVRPESVLSPIDELVQLRNQVSHGDNTNILSPSGMEIFCDFIEATCIGINDIINITLIGLIAEKNAVYLGNPIDVINHDIICIQTRGLAISVGDWLGVALPNKRPYSMHKVVAIELDRVQILSCEIGYDIPHGFKITGRAKPKYDICWLKAI